ncbi:MAG: electron transfer flavoprotein subunit beta/FixA family protein [Candidatus Hodarchaeota archaeon]
MNVVVCIKQVPGTSDVEVDENGSLIRSGVDSKMNPFDLFAIETAMRIKEEKEDIIINVISMGPPQAEEVIREAYMMGVDDGFLLTDRKFAGSDVLATSFTISQGIKKIGNTDLIICGKQTTDGDTAQVGAEIAEFLDIPHVTNVKKIVQIKESSIVVESDLPTMIQVVELEFPCLITVEKDIYQPRLPSFKKKLATKDKDITMMGLRNLDDYDDAHYGLKGSPTRVQRVFPPESNVEHVMWKGKAEDVARKLGDKLKELKFI